MNTDLDVESTIRAVLGEMETTLDSKRVLGEPTTIGEYTIIPLVSVGFGFGVGNGTGRGEELMKGEGSGWASAGGGGMKPLAVILIGPEGARIESIKGATASVVESLATSVVQATKKADKPSD